MADPQVVAHEGLEVAPNVDKPFDYSHVPQPGYQPRSVYQHIPPPDQTYRPESQPNLPSYPPESTNRREVLGLRFSTFFLVLALIVVILAAAIGAGVGATSAVHNAKASCASQIAALSDSNGTATSSKSGTGTCATSTITSTVTASSSSSTPTSDIILTPPMLGVLDLNCPTLTGTQLSVALYTAIWTFDIVCGTDFNGGNILAITAYSLQNCAQACATYNRDYGQTICQGVSFLSNLTLTTTYNYFGNCFLKNDTSSPIDNLGEMNAVLKLLNYTPG